MCSLFKAYLFNHDDSMHETTWRMWSAQLSNSSKKNQIKRSSDEGVIQFTNQVISTIRDSDLCAFNEEFRPAQNELSYKPSYSIILVHDRSPNKWIQPKNNPERSIFVHSKDCIYFCRFLSLTCTLKFEFHLPRCSAC